MTLSATECNPFANSAIRIAELGLPVHPLRPGSNIGMLKGWPDRATADVEQVGRWALRYPDSNVGIATGRVVAVIGDTELRHIALDVDPKHGGFESLADLELDLGCRIPRNYVVVTPSGGEHIHLLVQVPAGVWLSGRVGALGPGLDIRASNNTVVAPGSVRPDGVYLAPSGLWGGYEAMPVAPPAFTELLLEDARARKAPREVDAIGDVDTDRAIDRAIDYLERRAPLPEPGEGNNTTFTVACRVMDFGVSVGTATDLMQDHWNEDCESPRSDDELARIVENAARYRRDPAGVESAAAQFEKIGDGHPVREWIAQWRTQRTTVERPVGSFDKFFEFPDNNIYAWKDPKMHEPRPMIYGAHLGRGYVSATVSPGGIGKSSLLTVDMIAMAAGINLIGDSPLKPLTVAYLGEDPLDEIKRRITAAICVHDIDPASIGRRIIVKSMRSTPFVAAKKVRDEMIFNWKLYEELKGEIQRLNIDVLIIDAFVSSHQVPENDNGAQDALMKQFWNRLAEECGIAIEIVCHTRKTNGGEISAEDLRGAIAVVNAARSVRVLNRMSAAEALKAGIERKGLYFRIDDDLGKTNMRPPADKVRWHKLENFDFENGNAEYKADRVGVVVPWEWPEATDGITVEQEKALMDKINSGDYWLDPRTKINWVGDAFAEILGLNLSTPLHKAHVKEMIREFIEWGSLEIEMRHFQDPNDGKNSGERKAVVWTGLTERKNSSGAKNSTKSKAS